MYEAKCLGQMQRGGRGDRERERVIQRRGLFIRVLHIARREVHSPQTDAQSASLLIHTVCLCRGRSTARNEKSFCGVHFSFSFRGTSVIPPPSPSPSFPLSFLFSLFSSLVDFAWVVYHHYAKWSHLPLHDYFERDKPNSELPLPSNWRSTFE